MVVIKRILLLMTLMLLATTAYAQSDPRMVVEVTRNERGEIPAVQEAVQQALTVLWDRILPVSVRSSVPENINATQFLQRVVPHGGGVQVTFNHERVWQYLDQQQIAYLREAPHLNLMLQMSNQNDVAMPQTESALQRYAEQVAEAEGIVLDQGAPLVTLSWRWLDASQIALNVHGGGLAEPISQTRLLSGGDPLVLLQGWLREIMLGLRDAGVAPVGPPMAQRVEQEAPSSNGILLTIEQPASLPQQVVLEDALRQNGRVESMVPVYLNAASRQYRLVLKGGDDGWIEGWFRKRGMLAQQTPEGWLVR